MDLLKTKKNGRTVPLTTRKSRIVLGGNIYATIHTTGWSINRIVIVIKLGKLAKVEGKWVSKWVDVTSI